MEVGSQYGHLDTRPKGRAPRRKSTEVEPREPRVEITSKMKTNELVVFDVSKVPDLPEDMTIRVAFFQNFPDTDIGGRLASQKKNQGLVKRIENYYVGEECKKMNFVHCEVCFDLTFTSGIDGRSQLLFVPDTTPKSYDVTTHLLPVDSTTNGKFVAYGVVSSDGKGNIGRVFCKKRWFDRDNYQFIHMMIPKEQFVAAVKMAEALVGLEYDSRGMKGSGTLPTSPHFKSMYCSNTTAAILAEAQLYDGINVCGVLPDEIHAHLRRFHKDKMFNDVSMYELNEMESGCIK